MTLDQRLCDAIRRNDTTELYRLVTEVRHLQQRVDQVTTIVSHAIGELDNALQIIKKSDADVLAPSFGRIVEAIRSRL